MITSIIKKRHLLSISILFLGIASLHAFEKLSNGLVEVRLDSKQGTFDVFDIKKNQMIIENSKIGFSIADYIELNELGDKQIETDVDVTRVISSECSNRIGNSRISTAFSQGNSLSIFSRSENIGELEVRFTLYPNSSHVDIGFSFHNLANRPIRLREVNVVNTTQFLPGSDIKNLRFLNGGSGYKANTVKPMGNMVSENNLLCFLANPNKQRSLVLGGLSYVDFRKYIKINSGNMIMYAHDHVGKRVDPGKIYISKDYFYIDGNIEDPFYALENYAESFKKAQNININYYTFPSTCLWFLAVRHFGGDDSSLNNTVGAVKEMDNIIKSGFLKYSPVAVRLVPDCYEQNNEQGWWDNEHWQMHGRLERCIVDSHYAEPYETTQKWASKVLEMGGIPLTYFQPGIRSEDYAKAFPGHMLYNRSDKYILKNGKIIPDTHPIMGDKGVDGKPGYGKLFQEPYDYTDNSFAKHWRNVNTNLNDGGMKGVFYDYPSRALAIRGGMEDRYATALSAYTDIFRIAREEMGDQAYLQERLGIGSDATLGYVSSVRTAGDNNVISSGDLTKVALRWYKNRRLTNYDMDGKALLSYGARQQNKISDLQRKAILTLSYATTGRLLLTESFRLFPKEVLHDLSRVFPFHTTPLSARPLDAFIRENTSIFDFPISEEWHQLVLYNDIENSRQFDIELSGNTAFGSLGLNAKKEYYIYDFWNDNFVGKVNGKDILKQNLPKGEARMLSIHAVKNHPQWISTDRHVMQGYVDLVMKPEWHDTKKSLSGTSSLIAKEEYRITFALNGFNPKKVNIKGAESSITIRKDNPALADLVLKADKNRNLDWEINFTD
jgi:hypothetical protein